MIGPHSDLVRVGATTVLNRHTYISILTTKHPTKNLDGHKTVWENNGLGKGGGDNIELLSTYGFKQKYKKSKKYNNYKNDKVQTVQKVKTAQKAHKSTNTIQNI